MLLTKSLGVLSIEITKRFLKIYSVNLKIRAYFLYPRLEHFPQTLCSVSEEKVESITRT